MNWRDPWHSRAGGAELYAWQYARALVEAGARVDFVTAREPEQSRREVVDGIHVVRRGGALTFYAWALGWLLRRRRLLDGVLDADCGIPVFSPLVLSRRRTAVVLLVHHVHVDQFGLALPKALAILGRVLEGWVMPRLYRGRTVVAVSESTRSDMAERLGWRGEVRVLHNGSSEVFGSAETDEASETDRLVVLGRLAPHKRVEEVVRAVGLLRERRPGLRLDVVGRGPMEGRVRAVVSELGLQDAVSVHGFLDEDAKRVVVGRARLHVCASDAEGWGQVVIEAAALGVPTLARRVPGVRDSVRDGVTGWLLDGTQGSARLPEQLAHGIDMALRQLDDPRRRAHVVAECRAWSSGFSWEAMRAGAQLVMTDALASR